MSIFSAISKAAHSAVSWFEKQWASFEKNAPTVEALADHAFKYSVLGLKVVLAQVGPDTAAGKVISDVIKNLLTVSSVVYDVGAHSSLSGVLQTIVADLNSILDEAHIKNAATRGSIAKIIQTIEALVEAFMGNPAALPPAA